MTDTDVELDDEEYEELRPEMSRRRKVGVIVLGVFLVLALLAGLVSFWAYRQLFPTGKPGTEIVFEIPRGSSTSSIADLLEKKAVIDNAFLFKLYVRAKNAGPFQFTIDLMFNDRAVYDRVKGSGVIVAPLAPLISLVSSDARVTSAPALSSRSRGSSSSESSKPSVAMIRILERFTAGISASFP